MDWLFEGNYSVYFFLFSGGTASALLWVTNRYKFWAILAIVLFFGAGCYFVLDKTVETKIEKATWVVNQIGLCLQEKKYQNLNLYLAPDFYTPKGASQQDVIIFLNRFREPDRISGLVTWGMEFRRNLARNKGFVTSSKIKIKGNFGQYQEAYYRVEIEFRFAQEKNIPLIYTYQVFDPIQENQIIDTGI